MGTFRFDSVLVDGDQGHHKELQDLVMKEMKNNAEFYGAQFLESVETAQETASLSCTIMQFTMQNLNLSLLCFQPWL